MYMDIKLEIQTLSLKIYLNNYKFKAFRSR